MDSKVLLFASVFAVFVTIGYAGECCTPYNDIFGTHHESQVCADFCCWDLSITSTKVCCSDIMRQVPEGERDDCVSWINEHIWVPIVSVIIFLAIVIGICTCCCCCACCRSSRPGVVVQHGFGGPSQTVVVSQQQQQMMQPPPMMQSNPAHAGYVQ